MAKKYYSFISILALSLTMIMPPAHSNTNLSGCPSTWNIESPKLNIGMVSTLSNGINVHLYTSNLYGSDNYANQWRGARYPVNRVDPRNGSYALELILPDVYKRLIELGSDATWKSKYEILNQNFKILNQYAIDEPYLFDIPERPWELIYRGIGKGTEIQWKLTISVKSCPDYILRSSTYKFSDLATDNASLDNFLKQYKGFEGGREFNFKEVEFIKSHYDANKKLIIETPWAENTEQVSTTLNQIKYGTDIGYGNEFSTIYSGLVPVGCAESFGNGFFEISNPSMVFVKSNPCSVGAFANFPLSEESKCSSNSCKLDPEYLALLQISPNYLQGRTRVMIDSFKTKEFKFSSGATPKNSTIKCKKGKKIRIIKGLSPKCPSGFRQTKN